jgi:hypothetical protein
MSNMTTEEHVSVLERALKDKGSPMRTDIDFTIHISETGEQFSTVERVCKGDNITQSLIPHLSLRLSLSLSFHARYFILFALIAWCKKDTKKEI